eukprot:g13351.t1
MDPPSPSSPMSMGREKEREARLLAALSAAPSRAALAARRQTVLGRLEGALAQMAQSREACREVRQQLAKDSV